MSSSRILETNVTALKVIGDRVFAGVGNGVEVFSFCGDRISILPDVLSGGTNIHGILEFSSDVIAVFGGKELCVIRRDGVSVRRVKCSDWILSWIKIDEESMGILTMHNQLLCISPSSQSKRSFSSDEKCILYSGLLKLLPSNDANFVLVISGTVFREILIWKCNILNNSGDCPILHRLKGHEGVVFSLSQFQDRYLVSTSDDRTARLWKVKDNWEDISLVSVLDQIHTSRIFRSCVTSHYVILGGEDGFVSLWNIYDGKFVCKFQNSSSPIWSLDVSPDTIFAGSGVSLHSWLINANTNEAECKSLCVSEAEDNDYPKALKLLPSSGDVLCLTDGGRIKINNTELFSDSSLRNYGLLELDSDEYLYVGNLFGEIFIFDTNNTNELALKNRQKIFEGKVYSLFSLENRKILMCGPDRHVCVFDQVSHKLVLLTEFKLPPNKHQWWISCAALVNDSLIVIGDRNGSLFLAVKKVECCLHRLHGKQGVGDVKYSKGVVISVGRDGTLRSFSVIGTDLVPLNLTKLDYSWIERILISENEKTRLLGFHSTDFVVYDVENQNTIIKIACGGCHRSWDFLSERSFDVFVYIKDKRIYKRCFAKTEDKSVVLKPNYHTKEINFLKIFKVKDIELLLTGGEDTLLKIRRINDFWHSTTLRSHISNVRCADIMEERSREWAIAVTAGGRAELKVWRFGHSDVMLLGSLLLKGNDKRRKKVWRDKNVIPDVETRITSVHLFKGFDHVYKIVAACSDGILRLLKYGSFKISLINESSQGTHCLLIVKGYQTNRGRRFLTGSTNGSLQIWTISEGKLTILYEFKKAHQSGINSVDIEGQTLITGGDDGAVSEFQLTGEDTLHRIRQYPEAHSAQVTGVKYRNKFIVSCGIDQKLLIWNRQSFVPEEIRTVNVADVKGIDLCSSGVLIGGEGIQLYELPISKDSKP